MNERLRNLGLTGGHPRDETLSRFVDEDLDERARQRVASHVRYCGRCRQRVGALAETVRVLGSIGAAVPADLADSTIAAFRADSLPEKAPSLTLIEASSQQPSRGRGVASWPSAAQAAFRYCLSRSQLALTLPITIVAGVVLTVVNMGGMLARGRIDVGMCLMCATDFLVPFIAVNLVLLMVLRAPWRRRGPRPRRMA
jgi:hypothetical protein